MRCGLREQHGGRRQAPAWKISEREDRRLRRRRLDDQDQRQAEETLGRLIRQQPSRLTPEETARIRCLTDDIPALWQAPSTSGVERQTILRALVEHVVVEVLGRSERVAVLIRWAGGFESRHEIRRAVAKFEQLESADVIRARIVALTQQGWTHALP